MRDRRGPHYPWCLLVLAWLAAAVRRLADEAPAIKATNPPAPVRDALGKGNYPWYDAKTDAVKPLWPPREWDLEWLDRWLGRWRLGWLPEAGSLISIMLAMAGLAILLIVLLRLWRYYQPAAARPWPRREAQARRARIEGLPEGLRPETDDPWSEAVAAARGATMPARWSACSRTSS